MDIYHTFERPDGADPSGLALQQAERLLALFQKALGHDLPNRLVALQGLARLVEEEQRDRLDDEGRHLLGRLADLARRADAEVRALGDLGRLLREPLGGPPLAVAEVAREAAAEVRVAHPSAEIELRFEEDVLAWPVSRQALHAVLAQLLRNAVAAAVPGRPLCVEVGARRAAAGSPWGAELWVRDNGRGLPEARQDQLFDPPPARRDPDAGPGLGLFLVRQIVAGWGGAIRVCSEPGQGTTFTLLLPYR